MRRVTSRYEKAIEETLDSLPSPPPRGQSSVQTVQALKMKIEAGVGRFTSLLSLYYYNFLI
jgi:hypothetical protein